MPTSLGRVMRAAPLLMLCAAAGRAQDSAAQKPLTPQSAISMRTIEEAQFSPDGARLAFVVAEPPKGTGRARHLWMLDVQSGESRQFTFTEKSASHPRWSPDGKTLAFLSNREERNQVYLISLDGGEAHALTSGKRSVSDFAWSPDGKSIAFIAADTATAAQDKKEKDKDDARVVDKEDRRTRLWVQAVAGGDARALTPATSEVQELVWSAPGDRIIVAITETPQSDENTARIAAVRVSDGHIDSIVAPRGPFGELRVSASGKTLGYVGARKDGPEPHDLFLLPLAAGGAPKNVTASTLDRPISEYEFTGEEAGLALAEDGFHNVFAPWSAQGVKRDSSLMPMSPVLFAISASGTIAYVGVSPTRPPELYLWDKKAAPRRVTHINEAWDAFALVTPTFFTYKSFDGRTIEASLMRPAGVDAKKKLPLVLLVHGGPTGRWTASVEPWGQLLAAHGYAVLYVNIRGSVGYGQNFIELNRADWGGADYKDLMSALDHVIAAGGVDGDKLGIGGWSYGGYMAEWAITQTTRFKASVSGAGMANLESEFGTEGGSAYDEWFWGTPYENGDRFAKASPIHYLKNVKTPTLILQGEADPVDPLGQSQELYRGLKHYGVDAELVIYPREPHGLQEELHLIDRLNRIIAWYDKYLK